MFQYFRLQFCCLIILVLLSSVYEWDLRRKDGNRKKKNPVFVAMIILGAVEIVFDGLSAVTVNYLSVVPLWLNLVIHGIFLESLLGEVFLYFIYMLLETDSYPRKEQTVKRHLIYIPYSATAIGILVFLGKLEFRIGRNTNYSMGISVYLGFSMFAILFMLSGIIFLRRWKYISRRKRSNIAFFLVLALFFSIFQIAVPEALITSACILLLVLGVYLTVENPLHNEIAESTGEMVMGFATLVENRDDNTGGHIRRTRAYVEILAEEMRSRGVHSNQLTADYIYALKQAAPMHDVGKVAIPDSILRKPGRLTEEEYEIMKTHSNLGADIIKKTFGHTGDNEFTKMAFEVTKYHHEKWNGKGYPEGLSGNSIPLSARIMAIADVFDAVTEKRCYKDALPLEESFRIIEKGAGIDFDPEIVDIFLSMKDTIKEIHDGVAMKLV